MRTSTLCKAVAVVTALSLIAQPRIIIIVPLIERGGPGTVFALMLLTILALAIIAVAGLWQCRWWGFLAFYGYGVSSTLLLGSTLIPFVIAFVPTEARVEGVVALNAVALTVVAFLHWRHGKTT